MSHMRCRHRAPRGAAGVGGCARRGATPARRGSASGERRRSADQPRARAMRTRPDAATLSVTGRRPSVRSDVHVVPHTITRSFPRALAARRTLTVSFPRELAANARKPDAAADAPLTWALASTVPLDPRSEDDPPALSDADAAGAMTGPTGFE